MLLRLLGQTSLESGDSRLQKMAFLALHGTECCKILKTAWEWFWSKIINNYKQFKIFITNINGTCHLRQLLRSRPRCRRDWPLARIPPEQRRWCLVGSNRGLFSIGKWKQDYKDFQSLAIERMRANLLMKTEKRNFFESFLFKLMKI